MANERLARKKRLLQVLGGATAFAALAWGLKISHWRSASPPSPAQTERPTSTTEGAVTAASVSKDITVNVEISVSPPSAVLNLDGHRLAGNPYIAALPSDQAEHVMLASANGYEPVKKVLSFGKDLKVDFTLRPLAASGAAKPRTGERERSRSISGAADTKPAATSPGRLEPGVDLRSLAGTAPPSRRIEEKDPYSQ